DRASETDSASTGLRHELESVKAELSAVRKRALVTDGHVAEVDAELLQVHSRLVAAKKRAADLEDELLDARHDVGVLSGVVTRAEDVVGKRCVSCTSLDAALRHSDDENRKLLNDVATSVEVIQNLEERLLAYEDTLSKKSEHQLQGPKDVIEEQLRRLRGIPKLVAEVQFLCSRLVRDVQLDAAEVAATGSQLPRDILHAAADSFSTILDQIGMCSQRCASVGESLHDAFMAACVDVLERANGVDSAVHGMYAGLLHLEKHLHGELPVEDFVLEACLRHVEDLVTSLQQLPLAVAGPSEEVQRLKQSRRELKHAIRELIEENSQLREQLDQFESEASMIRRNYR
ncbi:Hypothetical protein, putative, partial [Bodo saltans]